MKPAITDANRPALNTHTAIYNKPTFIAALNDRVAARFKKI